MAPPPLPNEILARILELMSEGSIPNRALLRCARTSRTLSALAIDQLYRRLEVNFYEGYSESLRFDETRLETTLLRYRQLGMATREIRLLCDCSRYERLQEEADEHAARTLGILLACCPRIARIEIGWLSPQALREAPKHVAETAIPLRKLELYGAGCGVQERGEGMHVNDLRQGLRGLKGVAGLAMDLRIQAAGALIVSNERPVDLKRNSLPLGSPSYFALLLLAPGCTDTLKHIALDLCDDWDPAHLYRCLPTFTKLAHIELVLPDLLAIERILPTLALCTSLSYLHLSVWPHPGKDEADRFQQLDFTTIPPSLEFLNLRSSGTPWLPIKRMWQQSHLGMVVAADMSNWSEDDRIEWNDS